MYTNNFEWFHVQMIMRLIHSILIFLYTTHFISPPPPPQGQYYQEEI